MSTAGTPPKIPRHPARGNRQGQTTQAAKIDRWQTLSDNLEPHLDEAPHLRDLHAALRQTLEDTQELGHRVAALTAELRQAVHQHNAGLAAGEALFGRLRLGLQSLLGPKNGRLFEFGLRPWRKMGRPKGSSAAIAPASAEPAE